MMRPVLPLKVKVFRWCHYKRGEKKIVTHGTSKQLWNTRKRFELDFASEISGGSQSHTGIRCLSQNHTRKSTVFLRCVVAICQTQNRTWKNSKVENSKQIKERRGNYVWRLNGLFMRLFGRRLAVVSRRQFAARLAGKRRSHAFCAFFQAENLPVAKQGVAPWVPGLDE